MTSVSLFHLSEGVERGIERRDAAAEGKACTPSAQKMMRAA